MDKASSLIIVGLVILSIGVVLPGTTTENDCANPNIDYQGGQYQGGCDIVVEEEKDNPYKEPVMVVGGGIVLIGFVMYDGFN